MFNKVPRDPILLSFKNHCFLIIVFKILPEQKAFTSLRN